ncbi:MAG: class I SAM-dependent methyltransferase [Verrucomicrobia bacterium]|nr:class I SAM-dependent methyltransferase [Verrucomicrobiota bacterium]
MPSLPTAGNLNYPCLIQSPDDSLSACWTSDWALRKPGRFHPPGFLDWLESLPEIDAVPLPEDRHFSVGWNALGTIPVPPDPKPGFSTFRESLFDHRVTDAYRIVHGQSDGFPGWYVDRWGGALLVSGQGTPADIPPPLRQTLHQLVDSGQAQSLHFQPWEKAVRGVEGANLNPVLLHGSPVTGTFSIIENGLKFGIRFSEGYSVGLFTDHRDNRRRWLQGRVTREWPLPQTGELLNTFAYTCGFSVAAARLGWRTTSLDLSKKYLDWGRKNFELNGQSQDGHDFIFGDAMEWMSRWANKKRRFDAVILDPPTFSKSRDSHRRTRLFRAEKDFVELAEIAGRVLGRHGVLMASTNAAQLTPMAFLKQLSDGLFRAGHKIDRVEFCGQGPDFPIGIHENPHLKCFWIRVE